MKVAIAASGTTLDGPTDPRFGRCACFVIVETDSMVFEAVDNIAAAQGSGAGIAAVQLVADKGADAVIAANVGPNAFTALSAGGLKVYGFAGRHGSRGRHGTVGRATRRDQCPQCALPPWHGCRPGRRRHAVGGRDHPTPGLAAGN